MSEQTSSTPNQQVQVRHNESAQRFEAELNGQMALLEYRRYPQAIAYTHTEVPEAFQGRGIGAELVKAALAYAREQKLPVIPLCTFVAGYLRRHPEYHDAVQEEYRARVWQTKS